MFSPFGKREAEVAVVFDIGNGSIGVAVVEFRAQGIPFVHYTHREPLTFIQNINSERLLETMLKLLKAVAEHFAKEALPHIWSSYFGHTIRHVYCIVSSPWYASQTKIVKLEKDKPFPITKAFIEDMVKKEQELFTKDLKEGRYQNMFGADVRLLEKKIIHTKLNGYEVVQPIGKIAREVEVTFFSSFISADIMKQIEQVLGGVFHFKNVEFFSYALASWSGVRDMHPDLNNFIFLDISGEVTDVMLTSKAVLMETVSFPLGRSLFLRTVVEKLSVTPEVAESYLAVHADRSGEEKFAARMGKIIEEAEELWFQALIKILGELEKKYPLPIKMFITVDTDVADYFIDVLKRTMPLELNLMQNSFEVIFLDAKTLRPYVECKPTLQEDPFLSIEAVFLNKVISLS